MLGKLLRDTKQDLAEGMRWKTYINNYKHLLSCESAGRQHPPLGKQQQLQEAQRQLRPKLHMPVEGVDRVQFIHPILPSPQQIDDEINK